MLAKVLPEMERLNVDILRISEILWNVCNDFSTTLSNKDEKFRVICSGGSKNRTEVAFILRKRGI